MTKYTKFIEPTDGRVVAIKYVQAETKTKSGIILPTSDELKHMPQIMEITHVSKSLSHKWKPGDIIAIPMYSGIKVKLIDTEFSILDEAEILGEVIDIDEVKQMPGQIEMDV